MIKSKKGSSGVEFGEFIIPGAIMLVIVLVGAGFYYGFFTSESLREIRWEGESILDPILESIKRDISVKIGIDPKTNAEEAFDEIVKVVRSSSFTKDNSLIRLKDIGGLGKGYTLYFGNVKSKLMLNLYDRENSKLIKNEVFENKGNFKFGYFYFNEHLIFFPSRVAFYTNPFKGYEIRALDANVKDFRVSALPILGYRVVGDGKTKEVQIGWILGLNAEETLKYFNKD